MSKICKSRETQSRFMVAQGSWGNAGLGNVMAFFFFKVMNCSKINCCSCLYFSVNILNSMNYILFCVNCMACELYTSIKRFFKIKKKNDMKTGVVLRTLNTKLDKRPEESGSDRTSKNYRRC